MRLAVHGHVNLAAGSVAAADSVLLRQLLRTGHEIDLFHEPRWCRPPELDGLPGYRFVDVPTPPTRRVTEALPPLLRQLASQLLVLPIWWRRLERAVETAHSERRYDALLFLGLPSKFALRSVPTASWMQGPLGTEAAALWELRDELRRFGGRWLAAAARVKYAVTDRGDARALRSADIVTVGSTWSSDAMVEHGFDPARLLVLPYPLDLEHFSPQPLPDVEDQLRILWLGRIDPRKRFDLFLRALLELGTRGVPVHATIVGRFRLLPQVRRLLDDFPRPDLLTYRRFVPRTDVVALYRDAHVVVQPSQSENFGSTPAEALACGRPVVLGPSNGTVEVPSDAVFRMSAYTPMALADAVEGARRALRARPHHVSASARALAERLWAPAVVADDLVQRLAREAPKVPVPA